MKASNQYKIMATITLMLSSLSVFAQSTTTVELDTLTKVIGIGLTIGGFFMGYMQMRMANKIAEVEAKFNLSLNMVEKNFGEILHRETAALEAKIALSSKEIDGTVAWWNGFLKEALSAKDTRAKGLEDSVELALKQPDETLSNGKALRRIIKMLEQALQKYRSGR